MAPPLVQFLAKSPNATPKHFESLEKVFLNLSMEKKPVSLDKLSVLIFFEVRPLKVFVGAAPVGESLILEFLKKAPTAEFREVS